MEFRMRNLLALIVVVATTACFGNVVSAHEVFKKPLQEKYNLKSVSCKACHPSNKDKSIHNKFGMYFVDIFKGQELTKKYDEATKAGDEEKLKVEESLVVKFKAALKIVEKKQLTFEDMINAGLLNGTRLIVDKTKKK